MIEEDDGFPLSHLYTALTLGPKEIEQIIGYLHYVHRRLTELEENLNRKANREVRCSI